MNSPQYYISCRKPGEGELRLIKELSERSEEKRGINKGAPGTVYFLSKSFLKKREERRPGSGNKFKKKKMIRMIPFKEKERCERSELSQLRFFFE